MSESSERPTMRCAYHPERPAFAACFECFDQLCQSCTHRGDDGLARCGPCLGIASEPHGVTPDGSPGADDAAWDDPRDPRFVEDVVNLGTQRPQGESPSVVVPWENKTHPSDLGAFLRTVVIGIMHPIIYMQQIPWRKSNLMTPLIFAVLAGMLGQVGQTARLLANPSHIEEALKSVPELAHLSPTMFVLCLLPFIPITLAISLFLKSWIAHTLLLLINATRGPFEMTFRVFAYTEVATVLLLLPVLGPYAHKFYVVFLVLNGLRESHGAGLGAGLLALMPMLLLQALAG